ncbi:MAG: AEC family transporter [Halothece sp. Uz-M2-17]|nr:AEC family transporter [Halothece sp. Uz-M2-17]
MSTALQFLTQLYLPIFSAIVVGFLVSLGLSQSWFQRRFNTSLKTVIPSSLGQFLFWIGVPLSVINFLHQADLSVAVLMAPLVAWGAIFLALGTSWFWLRPNLKKWDQNTRGSFFLSSMFGNTGYMGFPVILLLPQLGARYFGWALFYDLLGTLLGAYGLGVFLAARLGKSPQAATQSSWFNLLQVLFRNPTVFAFLIGLALRSITFPPLLAIGLNGFAWLMVMLSLMLMGMRLQQLSSWSHLKPAAMAVSIRMFLIPLVVGMTLTALGVVGPPRLVMVLQSGMPCAFATLVLSENYGLNRDLAVAAVGLSSLVLLVTLPLWLWGFSTW